MFDGFVFEELFLVSIDDYKNLFYVLLFFLVIITTGVSAYRMWKEFSGD